MSLPPLFGHSGRVTPVNEPTKSNNIMEEEGFASQEYVMPSLPMKFSFNRIYLAPNQNQNPEQPPDLSLKAIFSKNANAVQIKARNAFLVKSAAGLAAALVVIIVIVLVAVLVPKGTVKETETITVTEAPSANSAGTIAPLTKIDSELINDLVIIDSNRICSSSIDGSVNIWNSVTGKNLQSWKAHSSPTKLALLANGQLVTGSLDASSAIKTWNPNTGALIDTYTVGTVTSLLRIDNNTLASGHQDSTIKLWNTNTQAKIKDLTGTNGDIFKLLLLSDGKLASGTSNGNIVIWDTSSGSIVRTIDGSASNDPVKSLVQISTTHLVSGCLDNKINFWNLNTGLSNGQLDVSTQVISMAYLTNSTLAFGGAVDVGIVWYESKTQFLVTSVNSTVQNLLTGHSANVNALVVTNDNRLVSGSSDGDIRFWNV